ncbi:MAG: radical SAM protein [Polyangiaceae bacterium]|nr:radical SAM protein [Polyangiaceae bacterium]MBK8940723.1 radical SAM protein [Polyangiaceae bacterium]
MSTPLRLVVWELTLACDLACEHCGSRAGPRREAELSTEEALGVVDQLAEMGAKEVALIGGEAYLREDWHVIAQAIRERGMLPSMVSGGRGITKERAELAARAGVGSVSLSIDGLDEVHDVQRGVRGSFDAALQAMRNLKQAGVPFSANSQINRLSFADLDAMLELFLELGCHGWQIAMTVPMGRAAERADWLLQPDDLLLVFPKLAQLAERGRQGGLRLFPGNNVGYFGPHEDALRGHLSPEAEGSYYQGCHAGVSSLGLEADGAVKGCPSLPTGAYTGGNVRSAPLREIWDHSTELAFARRPRDEELWGFCKGCYYASVCKAGCSWTAHVFFGKRGNNPYCHHRALVHDERGEREVLTLAEPGPGEPFDHGRWDVTVEPARSERGFARPALAAPKRKLRVVS